MLTSDVSFPADVCQMCRLRYVFEGRRPGRAAPRREAQWSALLLSAAAVGWLHHGDARWALATAMLLASVAWLWVRWARGCPDCAALRRQLDQSRAGPQPVGVAMPRIPSQCQRQRPGREARPPPAGLSARPGTT